MTWTVYIVMEYSIWFSMQRVRNGHIKNKYHIFKNGSYDTYRRCQSGDPLRPNYFVI